MPINSKTTPVFQTTEKKPPQSKVWYGFYLAFFYFSLYYFIFHVVAYEQT